MSSADQLDKPIGNDAELAARYGNTPQRRTRGRIIAWIGAIAFVIVFAAWVVWVAFDGSSASIEATDTGHKVIDDSTMSISFDISMAAGSTASCALQAQNEQHAIVGWKIVEIAASDSFSRSVTETVRTTEMAVTGLIYRCWLT